MTNTNTAPVITVHYVLGGAYKGKSVSNRSLLTHASIDGSSSALCKRVKEDMLCDVVESVEITCPVCKVRAAKLVAKFAK